MSIEYGIIRGYGVEFGDIELLIDFAKVSEHISSTLDYADHGPISMTNNRP